MLEGLLSNASGIIVSVLAFLLMLPLVVFIHELGHFQTARLFGIRVDAFSIGFGPTLKSWVDRKGTVWKIAAIPLGGFVKFFGDANAASAGTSNNGSTGTTQFGSMREAHEASLTEEEKRVCFHFKPVWQRAAVVAAGPIANFVLAIVLFAGLFMTFGRDITTPTVTYVEPDSAAEEAGFEAGDIILTINGRKVRSWEVLIGRIRLASNEELRIEVDRSGDVKTLVATPRRADVTDAMGNTIKAGQLGIGGSNEYTRRVQFGPIAAVSEAIDHVGLIISNTTRFFYRLLTLREDPSQIGGPIRIAEFAGQAAESGFEIEAEISFWDRLLTSAVNFLQVAAVISVSVGFLNLLPVPVLDGGHLMFYVYEALTGGPVPEVAQAIFFRIGALLVFTMIVFVTINDVLRHVPSQG